MTRIVFDRNPNLRPPFEEALARALHEAKKIGGPWSSCVTRSADGDMVPVGFGEDPNGDFACLCREMAADIIAALDVDELPATLISVDGIPVADLEWREDGPTGHWAVETECAKCDARDHKIESLFAKWADR